MGSIINRPSTRPRRMRRPEAPLFQRYSGLRKYTPSQRRTPAGQASTGAQRQHEVGMARESRAGQLTVGREAAFHRYLEGVVSSGRYKGNIPPEVLQRMREAFGLGGVADPGGPRTYLGKPMPGEAPGLREWRERGSPRSGGRDSRGLGEYSSGRPMPGKVTGREQTIYGDLPKNYYERQAEMSRKGMVLVNGRWMTREMRDELSRHKWGKVTQERIDRIEGGEDKSYFNFTTPSGETVKLTGAQMRAVTALAESAKRGAAPEGLQLTPEDIANIRRYHQVVERGGEAARVDQAEAEFERQLDRLGEWQGGGGAAQPGQAAPAPRREEPMGPDTRSREPQGRPDEAGIIRGYIDSGIDPRKYGFTDEQIAAAQQSSTPPTDREATMRLGDSQPVGPGVRGYPGAGAGLGVGAGAGAGMGGIREELMGRAVGALDEVDAARAATTTPRPEFRDRLAMLEQVPRGEFAEAPQAPLPAAPRPDWLSPTDDRMVDEKAWLERIKPYTQPAGGERGLPAIPQTKTPGELSLEQDAALKTVVGKIQGKPAIGAVLGGSPSANVAAAVAEAEQMAGDPNVSRSDVVQGLRAAAGEDPEARARAEQVISKLQPAQAGVGVQPGAAGQTGTLEQGFRGAIDSITQSGVGWWYSRDDFRDPLIAQLTQEGSVLSRTIDDILFQTQGQPSDVRRKVVADKIYNSLFNVLDDFALEKFGANSKTGDVGSATSSLMMWVRPENFASDVAGSVNQALQPILDAKLRG